jgi:hypothetical protein
MNPGGKEGGEMPYIVGLILIAVGGYLFFDSVRVNSGGAGWISSGISRGRGGFMQTTSMGIVFVPLLAGIVALTYDSSKKWPWALSGLGIILIAIEILSRIRFVMNTKVTHLILMLGMIAVGAGLIARAVSINKKNAKKSRRDRDS